MEQSIRAVIDKGQQAINKYKSEGKEIPSIWNDKLNQIIYEYKMTAITKLLDKINEYYPIGLFNWLNENNKFVYKKNIEIETKLNDLIKDNNQDTTEFDKTVENLKQWYSEAIRIFVVAAQIGTSKIFGKGEFLRDKKAIEKRIKLTYYILFFSCFFFVKSLRAGRGIPNYLNGTPSVYTVGFLQAHDSLVFTNPFVSFSKLFIQ